MTWLENNDALYEVANGAEVVVGSGSQSTWRLRTADLKPRHFVITAGPEGTWIRRYSSDTVVALNGRQLSSERIALNEGDVVSAGSTHFFFWRSAPAKDAPRPEVKSHPGFLVDAKVRAAYTLDRLSTCIGRDESNAVITSSPEVSRFHAEVRREAGGYALTSMGAAGTRLNGKPLDAPHLLVDGDEIVIGDRTLRFAQAIPAGMKQRISDEDHVTVDSTIPTGRVAEPTPYLGVPRMSGGVTMAAKSPARTFAVWSGVVALLALAAFFMMRGILI